MESKTKVGLDQSIPILPSTSVKPGRGGGKRPGYAKYRDAIRAKHIPEYLRIKITNSEDERTFVRLEDIARECGFHIRNQEHKIPGLAETSIFWGLKYSLYYEGIWIMERTGQNEESIIEARFVTEYDELAASMRKKYRGFVDELPTVLTTGGQVPEQTQETTQTTEPVVYPAVPDPATGEVTEAAPTTGEATDIPPATEEVTGNTDGQSSTSEVTSENVSTE